MDLELGSAKDSVCHLLYVTLPDQADNGGLSENLNCCHIIKKD